ncbi:hypothetical protein RCL_jg7932.t1 [Rhizophagus clarus]|uniref:Helitron helicase-like domain-containing protein n=1 Tax=Rhizophagus clarus TaxID=94130 RepID=A0A8H3MEE4_9GLOM|nr:hypothetical protein RCL_jg7932.t1 [Rhizophagus clarus]
MNLLSKDIPETIQIKVVEYSIEEKTYFNEQFLHINAMMREYNLPSLFITLTAAETKWSHLKDILKTTGNKDTNPTKRPLHTALHFTHRKRELWNHVWKKPENKQLGTTYSFY